MEQNKHNIPHNHDKHQHDFEKEFNELQSDELFKAFVKEHPEILKTAELQKSLSELEKQSPIDVNQSAKEIADSLKGKSIDQIAEYIHNLTQVLSKTQELKKVSTEGFIEVSKALMKETAKRLKQLWGKKKDISEDVKNLIDEGKKENILHNENEHNISSIVTEEPQGDNPPSATITTNDVRNETDEENKEAENQEATEQNSDIPKSQKTNRKSKPTGCSTKQQRFEGIEKETKILIKAGADGVKPKCPVCGSDLVSIGLTNPRIIIDLITALELEKFVIQEERYICPKCKKNIEIEKKTDYNNGEKPSEEKLPIYRPKIDPIAGKGSSMSWSSIGYFIEEVYFHHISQYHLHKNLINLQYGQFISRAQINNDINNTTALIRPLYSLLVENILKNQEHVLHIDETYYNLKGKRAYVIVMTTVGEAQKKIIVYNNCQGRSKETIKEFVSLKSDTNQESFSWSNDGYVSYKTLTEELSYIEHRTPCIFHITRQFTDIIGQTRNKTIKGDIRIGRILSYIEDIKKLDYEIKELPIEERIEARKEKVIPAIDVLLGYLNTFTNLNKQDVFAKAIKYAQTEVPYLKNIIYNPYLAIDNNQVERGMKIIKKHMKNTLHVQGDVGWEALMMWSSLIETATLNNINVPIYIKILMEYLPYLRETETEKYNELLPWSDFIQREIEKRKKENNEDQKTEKTVYGEIVNSIDLELEQAYLKKK